MIKVSKRDNLDRYYLFKFMGFGLFLHHIHHDEPNSYHSHPWNGISLVFGRYWEDQFETGKRKLIWGFNWINSKEHHRVDLYNVPVWTLFFHFRRNNEWEVIDSNGKVLSKEPWRGIGGRTNYS